jgi:hypothetical protein
MYKVKHGLLQVISLYSLLIYALLFFVNNEDYISNIKLPNLYLLLFLPILHYFHNLIYGRSIQKNELYVMLPIIIAFISILITGDIEFFYPLISLLIAIRLTKDLHFSILTIVKICLFFNYSYILLNFLFASGISPYYILEPHVFDIYSSLSTDFRLTTSTIFLNSNGAGAAHAVTYLLIYNLSDKNYLFKFLIVVLTLLSGSLSAILFICVIEIKKYLENRKGSKLILIYSVLLSFVIVFLILKLVDLNPIGLTTRISRVSSFFQHIISNPITILVPNYILNGTFYTESSLLDLFLNFSSYIAPLLYLIYNSKAKLFLFYFCLTSASFTIYTALIIALLINYESNEIFNKTRRLSQKPEL